MENNKSSELTRENINRTLLNTLGITYDEFELLNHDEQQKLIRQYHRKKPKSKDDTCIVMIGSGDSAMFMRVKKHQKVLIGSGENSCFIEAGLTLEEHERMLDDQIDDMLYSRPKAFVKKIVRRIRRK